MEQFKEKKYIIEEEIVRLILDEVGNERLSLSQSKEITEFCVPKLKKISSEKELMEFIKEISGKWPIFSGILSYQQDRAKEDKKHEVLENIIPLIETGHIDEATDLAKLANQ